MTTPSLPAAALWYARFRHWPIFPLRPGTKEPFGGLGVHQATADENQVTQWWQRWPGANIGLHVGAAGLLALDLDSYKDCFQGAGFLTPDDENTLTNLTGAGGVHLLFALPEGVRYSNATGNLPPGIDVRCHGGYIVLPPSIHPNGTPYAWEVGYGPHELTPAPLPYALRAILDDARANYRPPGPPDSLAVRLAARQVTEVLASLDLETYGEAVYGAGRKWVLKTCPFNPETDPHKADKAAYVVVRQDGSIRAGCWHARCWQGLKERHVSGWKALIMEKCLHDAI